jgi:hypothetical protein
MAPFEHAATAYDADCTEIEWYLNESDAVMPPPVAAHTALVSDVQLAPPSVVDSTTPAAPAAMPYEALAIDTPHSAVVTPLERDIQSVPPELVVYTAPPAPTATASVPEALDTAYRLTDSSASGVTSVHAVNAVAAVDRYTHRLAPTANATPLGPIDTPYSANNDAPDESVDTTAQLTPALVDTKILPACDTIT